MLKKGCSGCGCLIFIILMFAACGSFFSGSDDTVDNNNSSTKDILTEEPIEEITTEEVKTEELTSEEAATESVTEEVTTEITDEDSSVNNFYSNNEKQKRDTAPSDGVRNYDDDSNGVSGTPSAVYYENCTVAKAAGAAPIHRGQPGYDDHLDRDGDGVGCDK